MAEPRLHAAEYHLRSFALSRPHLLALLAALSLPAACHTPRAGRPADSVAATAPVAATTPASRPWPPSFAEYATSDTLVAPSAPIDYAIDPEASRFRTFLEEARMGPADLGGHYRVVVWGCGKMCAEHLILDLRTGRTYGDTLVNVGCEGLSHTRTSALVMATPYENADAGRCPHRSTRFFVWTGTKLEELQPGVPGG